MAYALPLIDDEKAKQDQVNGSSVVGSTAQSNVIPGSSGGGAPTPQQPKRSSTNFTNFSTYLQANQGQGQRMANDRMDDIKSEVGKTTDLVNKDTNQFLQGQGVYNGSGKLNTSQFDTKNIKNDFSGTDFTKVGQQDFNKLYNQTSNEFGEFKPSQAKPTYDYLKDPNQVKNQAESFGGRVSELQDEYSGGQNYGRGLQNLDAFLLGQSDLGQKRSQGVQDTIDYAKKNKGSGINAINTAYDQFGNAAKGFDTAIAGSKKGYQQAYNSQLGDLQSQFQKAEGAVKGLKPNVNVREVDDSGNIVGGAPGQKAAQIFTAPNGNRYTVMSDQSQFDQLQAPLNQAYGNLSKVSGLTNQKVNPLGDYQGMYKTALDQATKGLVDQYLAKNQPVETLNSQPSKNKHGAMIGGIPVDITGKEFIESLSPVSMKNGRPEFNKDFIIPKAAKKGLEIGKTITKAGEGAFNQVELATRKARQEKLPAIEKAAQMAKTGGNILSKKAKGDIKKAETGIKKSGSTAARETKKAVKDVSTGAKNVGNTVVDSTRQIFNNILGNNDNSYVSNKGEGRRTLEDELYGSLNSYY